MIENFFFVFRNYTLRKLKGYSGDVLGALQQITEVAIYIFTVVFFYMQNI
jgi:cobalamin synthase